MDTIKPVLNCVDTTIWLDSTGLFTIDSSFVISSFYENCNVRSWNVSKTQFECNDIGIETVYVTIIDSSNNFDQCSSQITIVDSIKPSIITKTDTVYLNSTGALSVSVFNFNTGTNDACGIDTMWLSAYNFNCANTGLNPIFYYAVDTNGNLDSQIVTLLVLDTIKPTITCTNDTTFYSSSDSCSLFIPSIAPIFVDNCGILSLVNDYTNTNSAFANYQLGLTSIIWTVTDSSGNSASCQNNIILIDTVAPVIVCPSDTSIGFCLDTLIYALPIVTDNCLQTNLFLSSGLGTNAPFPIGNNVETYTATDSSGNSASCSFTVTVDQVPYIQLGPDTFICDYDEIILSAGNPLQPAGDSAFTYLWQDSTTLPNNVAFSAGKYRVIKTDSLGCSSSDSLILGVYTSPSLGVLKDTSICFGDTAILKAGPDSVGFYSFVWADSSSAINLMVFPDSSASYFVTKSDTNSCFISDTIVVTVNQLPTPNLGPDTAVCTGFSFTFALAQGLEGYLWNDSSSSNSLSSDSAGVYSVIVTDLNQCQGTDTVVLSLHPLPDIQFNVFHDSAAVVNSNDSSRVCSGVDVLLQVTDSFNLYFWSSAQSSQSINISTTGSYNVLVFDTNNCNSNKDFYVLVDTLPAVQLGNDTTICSGDTIAINAGINLIDYAWSNNDSTQFISIYQANSYSVFVTDSNGCIGGDTLVLSLDTIPRISIGSDTTICFKDTLLLSPGLGYIDYNWSFTADDASTVKISSPNVVYVHVIDSNQCFAASDTVSISNDSLPDINLSGNQSICLGDTALLDAGFGLASYVWSNSIFTQTQFVTTTGKYVVNVVDSNGCIGGDSVNVIVRPLPVINLGSNKRYCDGVGFNLQLTANTGVPYASYLWNTGQTSQGISICNQITSCGPPNLITAFPDTFSVTATNAFGCISIDSITINIGANPYVDITNVDTSYCNDDNISIVLNAGPGFTSYNWSNGEAGQIILVDTAGTYEVTITDANGCTNTDIAVILEYLAPIVNLGDDTSYCENMPINVTLNAGAGIGYVYNWSTTENTKNISVDSVGIYSVTVTTNELCDTEDKIKIGQVELPKTTLNEDTLVCEGTTLELIVQNDGYTYLWSTGSTDSAIVVNQEGSYSVYLRNKYCEKRDTAFVEHDFPPWVNLGPDSILCEGEVNVLNALFEASFVNYLWQDGSIDTTFDATYPGDYSVLLSNRCGAFLDNVQLFYEDCSNIHAPNAFTPNGDGDNDVYRLVSDQDFTFFQFRVFNRQGEEIFASSSIDVAWDGTSNGAICPSGNYVYQLVFSSALDVNGGKYAQTGPIVIFR